jgi:hypothetical protein
MARNNKNIIVGAAALYLGKNTDTVPALPSFGASATATAALDSSADWNEAGYTTEGIELSFEPDYGEVQVDQLLDVARIFKQGQRVMLNTTLAEGTLENLLLVIGGVSTDLETSTISGSKFDRTLDINAGALGYAPVERSLVAVGPAPSALLENVTGKTKAERVYHAYRALSMETVTVGIKRNEATVFPVSFRLLSQSVSGKDLYGKIIDRVY